MNDGLNAQYGCGLTAPKGWMNFDASPTLWLQRLPLVGRAISAARTTFPERAHYGDVVRGLPLADASCRIVYCSHVIEHLSLTDCRKALRETRRILMPGGIFRGVMPDLEILAKSYLADKSPTAAITFMHESLLGVKVRERGLSGLTKAALGNAQHLWMWDYKAFAVELANAGFVEIRCAAFGDSGDPAFAAVEDRSRWDDCLGFQCMNPF